MRGIDLDIRDGEFTVLVGPSGCGKSTLLRTIAGLEEASEGTIAIGGEVVNDLRPRDRDVAMVFQDYALYPHMNVAKNIGFGLKARKMPQADIDARVGEAARMLGITPLLDRYPRQLSGGQRQRVAIGRAIVRSPRVFLFDEPLSNLDAQLRDEMRGEIKRLHLEIATTMIYVTHDQIEAMTLADRIVLMRDGRDRAAGRAARALRAAGLDLRRRLPRLAAHELPARHARARRRAPRRAPRRHRVPARPASAGWTAPSTASRCCSACAPSTSPARHGAEPPPGHFRADAAIELVQPTGSRSYATFRLAGAPVMAELQAHDVSQPGERIPIDINMTRASIFDPKTDRAL